MHSRQIDSCSKISVINYVLPELIIIYTYLNIDTQIITKLERTINEVGMRVTIKGNANTYNNDFIPPKLLMVHFQSIALH